MRSALWVLGLASCYQPSPLSGAPCAANGACPGDQVCDQSQSPPTCVGMVGHGVDAAPVSDSPGVQIDAALPDGSVEALPWGTPTKVVLTGIPNGDIDDPTLTDDLLELRFNLANDIYVTTRASVTDAWAPATLDTALSSASSETTPEISSDGLKIYFGSDRPGTVGLLDIWLSRRATRADAWSVPTNIGSLNSPFDDSGGATTADGLTILINTNRTTSGGPSDIETSTRAMPIGPWPAPVPIAAVDQPITDEISAMLSGDQLTLYFESSRSGLGDLYVARRATTTDAFGAPQPIAELNTATAGEGDPWISSDGHHLFFASTRSGKQELYESSR